MNDINSDFIDSYITNKDRNIVNIDLNKFLTSIENNDLNILHNNEY